VRTSFVACLARTDDGLPCLRLQLRRQRDGDHDRSADGQHTSPGSGGRDVRGTGAPPVGTSTSEDETEQPGDADTDDDYQRSAIDGHR